MGLFKKTIGEVAVPGEATVTLPAGTVTINYDEQRKGRNASDGEGDAEWLGVPGGLDVTIAPAGGGAPLEIDRGVGNVEYNTFTRIGSRYGKVQVPTAGEHVVSVAPLPPDTRELYEPTMKLKA